MLQPGSHPVRHFTVPVLHQGLNGASAGIIMPSIRLISPGFILMQPCAPFCPVPKHFMPTKKPVNTDVYGFSLPPRVGLEPTTTRLTAECSTIELSRIICYRYVLPNFHPDIHTSHKPASAGSREPPYPQNRTLIPLKSSDDKFLSSGQALE